MKKHIRVARIVPVAKGWIAYSNGYPTPGRIVDVETIVGNFREKAREPRQTKVHSELRLKWKYAN